MSTSRLSAQSVGLRPLAFLLSITTLIYLPCLRFDFVYDDPILIVNNPRVHAWRYVPSYFQHHFWFNVSQTGSYYRPLVLLWLRINYALFGPHAALWHASGIAVHLVAVALVYLLLRRTVADALTVVVATGVFALHPAHIESVVWIAGVSESLMTVALVGSILLWLGFRNDQKRFSRFAALAVFVAALMVKETAAIAPCLIFVYEYARTRREDGPDPVSRALRSFAIYAAVLAVYLMVRWQILHNQYAPPLRSMRDAVANIPAILWFYLRHLVWPWRLSVLYDFDLHSPTNFLLLGGCLLVAAILALGVLAARKSNDLLVAWAWIVFPMATVIAGVTSFDPHDYVHERYLYLPVLGFGLLIGIFIRTLRSGSTSLFGQPSLQAIASLVVLGGLASATELQLAPWMNNLTLFTHAVQFAPSNPIGYSHLAFEIYRRGDPESSVKLYKRSVDLDPNNYPSNFGLAVTLYRLQQWEGAAEYCDRADRIAPDANNACYQFETIAFMRLSRWPQAEVPIRFAIAHWPKELGQHLLLGQILTQENKSDEAKREFERELDLDPGSQAAFSGLEKLAR